MNEAPLMPKATAVWLVENTSISFKQIANFCNLHEVEVQGIADGDVARGIKAYNPILAGQLTREEIELSSNDKNRPLELNKKVIDISKKERKKIKYIPLSKRQDRPDSVLWLIRNYIELQDSQISKLIGTTKNTVSLIRKKSYWNYNSLSEKDPVAINLCTQLDLQNVVEKAKRKIEREKKKKEKDKQKNEKEQEQK